MSIYTVFADPMDPLFWRLGGLKLATRVRDQMCLPESIIHCYMDHELSSEIVDNVTLHISSCSECDTAVIKAKEEAALLEFALAYEMTLPVPTERLGVRIKVAILAMTN